MAKKKKAPEMKAPLLRSDDPGTNCNSYIVHDPDHELAMKVTGGVVDNVLLDGVDISGGGGGGSTATITIQGQGDFLVGFYDTDTGVVNPYLSSSLGSHQYEVPLGENGAYLFPDSDTTISSVSGDIEDIGHGTYQITGDGTITVA